MPSVTETGRTVAIDLDRVVTDPEYRNTVRDMLNSTENVRRGTLTKSPHGQPEYLDAMRDEIEACKAKLIKLANRMSLGDRKLATFVTDIEEACDGLAEDTVEAMRRRLEEEADQVGN